MNWQSIKMVVLSIPYTKVLIGCFHLNHLHHILLHLQERILVHMIVVITRGGSSTYPGVCWGNFDQSRWPQMINQIYSIDVDMKSPETIWDYFVHGLDTSSFHPNGKDFFCYTIEELSKDMNQETWLCYLWWLWSFLWYMSCICSLNLKVAYICLCLIVNWFKKGLSKLNPDGQKHNNYLNAIRYFTLHQLETIEPHVY